MFFIRGSPGWAETNLICFNPPISNIRGQNHGGRGGRRRAGGIHKACSFHCYISPDHFLIALSRRTFQYESTETVAQSRSLLQQRGSCLDYSPPQWPTFPVICNCWSRFQYSFPMEPLWEDSLPQPNLLPNRDRERLHLSRYKQRVGSALPLCHIQKCRWLKVTWNPICARSSKSATAALRAGGADKEWKGKVWKGTGAREQRVPRQTQQLAPNLGTNRLFLYHHPSTS